jgi:hypothetical protein
MPLFRSLIEISVEQTVILRSTTKSQKLANTFDLHIREFYFWQFWPPIQYSLLYFEQVPEIDTSSQRTATFSLKGK